MESQRWLTIVGIALVVAIGGSSAVAAQAEAAGCGTGKACFWPQQGFNGNRSPEYSISGGQAGPWLYVGYPGPLAPARSAKNNLGARRVLIAESFSGGNPQNILCIPRNTQDSAFSTRYYFRIGANGSGNDC